eukprot:Polyplicarium_translucidae@DN1970_c0_g1_i1.p1
MNAKRKDDDSRLRIAIVHSDRCKPKKCKQECKRACPVNRTGKVCISVEPYSKISWISETLCIGCGICIKKCPFEAISIINLPKDLNHATVHRFGPNTFKLHRLPAPRVGQVLGLVGVNGIGKSTALKILAGKLKPNLGRFDTPPEWAEILRYFRGSELQSYFTRILEEQLRCVVKPQYVEAVAQIKKTVNDVLLDTSKGRDMDRTRRLMRVLQLDVLGDREVANLSGGELQRFSICAAACSSGNVFMFDEPSSYLDVRQRLTAARVIRELTTDTSDYYTIVVEHDLSILDYLSDFICCLWGHPAIYGVVTSPFAVREGINVFLDGYVPTENLRFRKESLSFKVSNEVEEEVKRMHHYEYNELHKQLDTFKLTVERGDFSDSEILVLLGQNGTGKTTFIRMLAGILAADNEESPLPKLSVSYKPQSLEAKYKGTVRELFNARIREAFQYPQFQSDVVKPLQIEDILDQRVQLLSGGELQRVALIVALGRPADIYLIDEPSAYLDSEQRIVAARAIKRYIFHAKKTAFVVEHDFIMATYLADRVVVYDGDPGFNCTARAPQSLISGMNSFLASLEITFRRDPINYRPRINKLESVKDKAQKESGNYFVIEDCDA